MSRKSSIPIRFTSKQKEVATRFIGKPVTEVVITREVAGMMKYGIVPASKVKTNMVILTAAQKAQLQKEFNCSCEYIEITKEMQFR